MAVSRLELAGREQAATILKGYDPIFDRWRFSKDTDFWKAVQHAHELGSRGQGKRVAIIDSACDLEIPKLARKVENIAHIAHNPGRDHSKSHGTMVALLILEVAPDCVLDIYNVVAEDGSVDEAATIEALNRATRSDAAVINLSIGQAKEWLPATEQADQVWSDPRERKRVQISEPEPCELCKASSRAAGAGKLVFAAVGNEILHAYCPARADNVIAVGFQNEQAVKPFPDKEIRSLVPNFDQALYSDIMLLQIPGALGTSFACPLYAGVGAWGLAQHEVWQFIASYMERVFPLADHARVETGGDLDAVSPQLRQKIEAGYQRSMGLLPHAHCAAQSAQNPSAPRVDPKNCPFCGVFAHLQYIHFGSWLSQAGRFSEALQFLQVARELCPWSAQPVAYEAATYLAFGDYNAALVRFELALRMRPGYRPYKQAVETLRRYTPECLAKLLASADSEDLDRSTRLETILWRQAEMRAVNWLYYLGTIILLMLHFIFRESGPTKWLLVVPVIVGLRFLWKCYHNAKISELLPQVTPEFDVRREIYRLTNLVKASAVSFLLSSITLAIILICT